MVHEKKHLRNFCNCGNSKPSLEAVKPNSLKTNVFEFETFKVFGVTFLFKYFYANKVAEDFRVNLEVKVCSWFGLRSSWDRLVLTFYVFFLLKVEKGKRENARSFCFFLRFLLNDVLLTLLIQSFFWFNLLAFTDDVTERDI